MSYDVGKDPYLDKVTGILRNLLGIKTQAELDKAEAQISFVQISTLTIENKPLLENFNWELLCKIHHDIFGEIYDWAGQPRTIELTKDKTSFARTDYIVASAKELFSKLAEEDYLHGLGSEEFIERLAHYYNELNVIHPFREGNGRAIRTFLTMLAENLGWNIAWNEMNPQENVAACIAAYNNDDMPLRNMLRKIIKKPAE
jgi:cell filamentation protein